MKKHFIIILIFIISIAGISQTAKDLFNPNDLKVYWLGIDFSHVKLIGDFSQFSGAGEQSNSQIRDKYFRGWNRLILSEPNKYDIKGMLRLDSLIYDIDMIMKVNYDTPLNDMESYNTPNYTENDIKSFISSYKTSDKEGIGILFLAESLNKTREEGVFHFVVINLKTKELLFHERLNGKPRGFGLRNYWAGSIYKIIKEIKNYRYEVWKRNSN